MLTFLSCFQRTIPLRCLRSHYFNTRFKTAKDRKLRQSCRTLNAEGREPRY